MQDWEESCNDLFWWRLVYPFPSLHIHSTNDIYSPLLVFLGKETSNTIQGCNNIINGSILPLAVGGFWTSKEALTWVVTSWTTCGIWTSVE